MGGYARHALENGQRRCKAAFDQLLEHESDGNLNYLLCAPLSNQSFRLFTDEVLPRIA